MVNVRDISDLALIDSNVEKKYMNTPGKGRSPTQISVSHKFFLC